MKYWILVVSFVFLLSCKRDRLEVNVKSVDVTLEFQRFDEFLFQQDTAQLFKALKEVYLDNKGFVDLYTKKILRIGDVESETFEPYLKQFVTDTIMIKVANSVSQEFSDLTQLQFDLTNGFKHYAYYFPSRPIPRIYTCISGFNQSLVFADDFVAIGLEKYLGKDCPFYQYLGIPKYKIANMISEKIVLDLFYGWALTEYPYNYSADNLLSNMVYQGKLYYFAEAMNPGYADSLIIGYPSEKLKWCEENEASMWSFMVEKQLLYSNDRLTLQKYIGDAPFTNSFSNDSPGRTGAWLGWKIVRSYMNNHVDITLDELMNNNDAQKLLNQSNYFPN